MIISKEMLKNNQKPLALLTIQLVLGIFVVFEFLAIIGFNFDVGTRQLSFGLTTNPLEYLFFVLSILLLWIFFSQGKKNKEVFVAEKTMTTNILEDTKLKIWKAKHEPKAAALVLIQFATIAVVVISIVAFFDPDFSLFNWERFGIESPVTTIINVILFLFTMGVFYYLYNYTNQYRKSVNTKKRNNFQGKQF
jgi:hypothetical protein